MKYVTHLNVDAKKVIRHMYYRYPRDHTLPTHTPYQDLIYILIVYKLHEVLALLLLPHDTRS